MRFEAHIPSLREGISRFRGKKEATPTSEVGQILSRAERHAKAVGKVFGLTSNPLVLSPRERRFFDFFVMEEVSLLLARNPEHDERLDRHLSEFDSLPKNVETHFDSSYKELVRTLGFDRRLTNKQLADLKDVQKPLRQAAQLMATSFLTNTPKTIADVEQVIGECKDLADEYKDLFEKGEFPKDILSEENFSLIEKAVAAEQDFSKKHPIITAGTTIGGVLAIGSAIIWELKQDVPPSPKNTPAILAPQATRNYDLSFTLTPPNSKEGREDQLFRETIKSLLHQELTHLSIQSKPYDGTIRLLHQKVEDPRSFMQVLDQEKEGLATRRFPDRELGERIVGKELLYGLSISNSHSWFIQSERDGHVTFWAAYLNVDNKTGKLQLETFPLGTWNNWYVVMVENNQRLDLNTFFAKLLQTAEVVVSPPK